MYKFSLKSLEKSLINPIKLALAFYLVGIIVLGGIFLLKAMNLVTPGEKIPWVIMATISLLYAVYSAIILVMNKNTSKSFRLTVYSFVVLIPLGAVTAWQVSGLTLSETGSFRTIYVILIMAFLCLLALSIAYKALLGYIDKQDELKLEREDHVRED